jgi:hypothetical protein
MYGKRSALRGVRVRPKWTDLGRTMEFAELLAALALKVHAGTIRDSVKNYVA